MDELYPLYGAMKAKDQHKNYIAETRNLLIFVVGKMIQINLREKKCVQTNEMSPYRFNLLLFVHRIYLFRFSKSTQK